MTIKIYREYKIVIITLLGEKLGLLSFHDFSFSSHWRPSLSFYFFPLPSLPYPVFCFKL